VISRAVVVAGRRRGRRRGWRPRGCILCWWAGGEVGLGDGRI
jgi:hypothetical protein